MYVAVAVSRKPRKWGNYSFLTMVSLFMVLIFKYEIVSIGFSPAVVIVWIAFLTSRKLHYYIQCVRQYVICLSGLHESSSFVSMIYNVTSRSKKLSNLLTVTITSFLILRWRSLLSQYHAANSKLSDIQNLNTIKFSQR